MESDVLTGTVGYDCVDNPDTHCFSHNFTHLDFDCAFYYNIISQFHGNEIMRVRVSRSLRQTIGCVLPSLGLHYCFCNCVCMPSLTNVPYYIVVQAITLYLGSSLKKFPIRKMMSVQSHSPYPQSDVILHHSSYHVISLVTVM